MRVGKVLVGVAIVMLTLAGAAWADDSGSMTNPPPPDQPMPGNDQSANPNPETPAEAPAAAAPSEGAIMQGFDAIGIGKGMKDLDLSIYGFVDAGYLHDFTVSHNLTPAKTAPGDDIFFAGPYKDQFILDQADLAIERTIDPMKGSFDIGFKIEGDFGRDAFFTHSDGVLDETNKAGGTGPDDQLDVPQAYVTVAFPIQGLSLKAGKFVSLLGSEQINPTANQLYTHSYEFSYGMPFTQTGLLGMYTINDTTGGGTWTFTGGVTRGWNQTWYYNNYDGVFQIARLNGPLSYTANLLVGPEGVLPYGPPDHADWWIVPEVIASYKISDQMSITGDILYGDATHLTQWFGAAGYLHYSFDKFIAFNGRAEFYYDQGGVTTGVGGGDIDYFEGTLGVAITPLPDSSLFQSLTIRPEIREDLANESVFDFSHRSQLTAAVDVYWKF
jgi:hypothetical protein